MKPAQKIFFVSAYDATFIRQDIKILSTHFQFKKALFPQARKDPLYLIYTFFVILRGVLATDITYAAFADLRAYIAVFWCRLLRKKSVILVGGYESAALPEINYGGLLKRGQARRFKYVLKHADEVITYSEFSKTEVVSFFPPRKISVIPLGIEVTDLPPKTKKNYIVTIGDATDSKWKLKGLEIFALASISQPGMKFIIIGNYSEEIKKLLLTVNSSIEFTGYIPVKEVEDILSKTKIYCQLSLRESFGLSVLEAMKHGAIPVVTQKGSLPEVVDDVGFFTEYDNIESTVNAIEKALIKGAPAKVRKRAIEHFDIKFREQKLVKLIESL
ncbi:MAG: hypothetical protein APR54_06815 [Candidatus Cloacimonas sp. SDB]|nr:MAG: hypothetical protein APR54_06815 [Candidatus Cloacimonas sp. SDB]